MLATLALLAAGAGIAASLPASASVADDMATLTLARDRAARADSAVVDLKHALAPGHLTDPMPGTDRTLGLEALRADLADMQRKVAGYRATLGDLHPTLVAAQQVMADLRGQLLVATRTALAMAEREAAEARAQGSAVERRLAGQVATDRAKPANRQADITLPAARPSISADAARPETPAAPARPDEAESGLAALVVGAMAVLVLIWAGLRLLRPRGRVRRGRPAPSRAEPASAAPVPEILPSGRSDAPGDLAATFAQHPGTARLSGLSGFDTVILVGDEALAGGADLLLMVAPRHTAPAVLAAVARPLLDAGQPCGLLLVERTAASVPVTIPRRRPNLYPATMPVSAAGLGLRGSIAPVCGHAGR